MTETVIQMEKTTGELMDILRSKPDAAAFVQENADELQNKTVPELLADLLERKQLTRAAVIRVAGLARTYGYQLFDGTYTPTRDKLIQLAFGFQLTVEETQALLKAAGHAVLYPRNARDVVIIEWSVPAMRHHCVQYQIGGTEPAVVRVSAGFDTALPSSPRSAPQSPERYTVWYDRASQPV